MRYTQAFDIWNVSIPSLATVQAGQWVFAGDRSSMGRFMGIKPSGVVVVAWLHNERGHTDRQAYRSKLRAYAKG